MVGIVVSMMMPMPAGIIAATMIRPPELPARRPLDFGTILVRGLYKISVNARIRDAKRRGGALFYRRK
jgi:hypothetical protein